MVTSDYYDPDWVCLVDFFCNLVPMTSQAWQLLGQNMFLNRSYIPVEFFDDDDDDDEDEEDEDEKEEEVVDIADDNDPL